MQRRSNNAVMEAMHTLFHVGTVGRMTDGQLLERFICRRDESAEIAFRALVERYGPMVLGVCRSVLHDPHDSEDAFQATFLVLVRKANSIRNCNSLGSWLYGVAHRVAVRAKVTLARRRVHERRFVELAATASPQNEGRFSDPALLQDEVARLPEKYRAPVVLCYLKGMTYDMAADQLHLTESTVRGRLSRARDLLRSRLTRRGLSLPAGVVATTLHSEPAAAAVPATLVEASLQTARRSITSQSISASVAALAEGVLKNMFLHQIKIMTVCAPTICAAAVGALALAQEGAEARPQDQNAKQSAIPSLSAASPIAGQDARKREQNAPPEIDENLARSISGRVLQAMPIAKDCMVLSYLPDWSHGEVDNIGLANNDGGVRTLLSWPDVPAQDAAATGRQFLVALYSRETTSNGPAGPILAFTLLKDWPERTSWKTQPDYEPEPAATYKFVPGTGWKLFDVTAIICGQANSPQKGNGLLLRFLSEDRSSQKNDWSGYQFVSREGAKEWTKRRPLLLVVEPAKK